MALIFIPKMPLPTGRTFNTRFLAEKQEETNKPYAIYSHFILLKIKTDNIQTTIKNVLNGKCSLTAQLFYTYVALV